MNGFILMDFNEALKLLKAVSAGRLRIFKQFSVFPENSSQQGLGRYVVFVDASIVKEPCHRELRDYTQACNLSIAPFGQYLIVSGQ